VNSGQVGGSNSLWLLSYRRFADLVALIFFSNGAAGQILAFGSCLLLPRVPRVGRNYIEWHWRKEIVQSRRSISFLLDSYGRLADFVVSESTAEGEWLLKFWAFRVSSKWFIQSFDYDHPCTPVVECVKPSGSAWIGLVGKYCWISRFVARWMVGVDFFRLVLLVLLDFPSFTVIPSNQ